MELQFPLFVAYNMQDKKIGCALVQPILGATMTGGQVSFYFDTIHWELNPTKCKVYAINNKPEFDLMIQITKEHHENQKTIPKSQTT